MQKQEITTIIVILAVISIVVIPNWYYHSTQLDGTEPEVITTIKLQDWQNNYKSVFDREGIESKYIGETDYYDYSSEKIKTAINEILSSSNNPTEAIQLTLAYVYHNVEYTFGEADSSCFNGKASTILNSGKGQCDTQSIVVITILRGMGIAARPVGGCAYASAYAIYVDGPIVEPIKFNKETGTASRGGVLHAWVEAWIPNKGWTPLEVTRGMFQSELKGYTFNVEMYPENNDKYHLCVSSDLVYARWCSEQ